MLREKRMTRLNHNPPGNPLRCGDTMSHLFFRADLLSIPVASPQLLVRAGEKSRGQVPLGDLEGRICSKKKG